MAAAIHQHGRRHGTANGHRVERLAQAVRRQQRGVDARHARPRISSSAPSISPPSSVSSAAARAGSVDLSSLISSSFIRSATSRCVDEHRTVGDLDKTVADLETDADLAAGPPHARASTYRSASISVRDRPPFGMDAIARSRARSPTSRPRHPQPNQERRRAAATRRSRTVSSIIKPSGTTSRGSAPRSLMPPPVSSAEFASGSWSLEDTCRTVSGLGRTPGGQARATPR